MSNTITPSANFVSSPTNSQQVFSVFNLQNFSKALCLAVFILIFFGALVTSNNAGLSVPDWPTSFGYNMFLFPPSQWKGGIFYEHVHRLVASVIGLMTLILAVWSARVEARRAVRNLSWLALVIVILQGVLGGLTVRYKLPVLVSSAHGILAQSFLVLVLVIAYLHSKEVKARAQISEKHYQLELRLALISAAFIYFQLIVGALMRHSAAGLAAPDFPTTAGAWWPDLTEKGLEQANALRQALHLPAVNLLQFAIHVCHRFSGFLVASFVFLLASRTFKITRVKTVTCILLGLVCLQVALGALTVLTGRHPLITSFHVWGGAALLALSVLTVLRLLPIRMLGEQRSE